MIQLIVCSIIIFFFFFLLLEELYKRYSAFSDKWLRFVVCLVLAIIFKFNFGVSFYGLEYEDSYVFDVLARYIAVGNTPSTFMAEVPMIGSVAEPVLVATHGGHFITYSVFLSYFYKIFGFSQWTLPIATSIISLLILLLLSSLSNKQWYIAPVAFCIAPIINLFSTSGLSELFSSLIILTYCISYISYRNRDNLLLLSLISLALAILCKRENLILAVLPSIDFCIAMFSKDKKIFLKHLYYCLYVLSIILVYLFAIRNVFAIEAEESVDIAAATFSFDYFKRLFPVFVSALSNINYFSLLIYLCMSKLFYDILKKQFKREHLLILVLFVCYIILYTSHYRGYFFVKYDRLSSFDSFRYLNNCIILLAIYLSISPQEFNKKLIFPFLIILLSFSCYQTISYRIDFHKMENENRFAIVDEVQDFVNSQNTNSCIITSTPLLYQIRGDVFQNIIEVTSWNSFADKIDCVNNNIFLVMDFDKNYIATRYNNYIDLSNFVKVHETKNGTLVFKYQRNEEQLIK